VQQGLTQEQVPLRIIPLGKAFAFQGALVVGKGAWIDALLQFARSHIYSTAVSPALTYGMLERLDFIRKADDRRQKLYDLIDYFRALRKKSSLKWRESTTAIQQLQLGCPHKALLCANYLLSKGIFCQAMREPTVNKKDTGLRVVLNYQHQPEDIDRLFLHTQHFLESEMQVSA
jgi:8-amino-7-oxononanoate synthase